MLKLSIQMHSTGLSLPWNWYIMSIPVYNRYPVPTYQAALRISNIIRHADMAMVVMKEEVYVHRSGRNSISCRVT